ncbi:pyridoxal phosphate-dependent transferase [Xylariomycetidae sp. FL0641]|nr:pyridoxal phosphate-dependent transferase [Xylariomycetidae sp. FL0641]
MSPTALQQSLDEVAGDAKAAVSEPTVTAAPHETVESALAAAVARFEAANPTSKQLHATAAGLLPGGNTRTLLHTSPFPLSMARGRGAFVWDEDGHKYTDFVGELTAGLYGHSHPAIRAAVLSTFDAVGLSLGATTAQEARYAGLLCQRFGLERVRFANTGTEANLHALNGARAFTGRRKVLVFGGGYHGAVLSFGGGQVAPNNVDRGDWVVGTYNDAAGARELIRATPDLAAVAVEAMQGAGGCVVASPEFLRAVETAARAAGVVFVLDEVMTSRLGPGGLRRAAGLRPDLVTLGKYLGGGFPFGAFGGRADVMAVYDPRRGGALAHSGTFNNNSMTLHAGYAGLATVFTEDVSVAFNAQGDAFRARLQLVCEGTKISFTGLGSIMTAHFSDFPPDDIRCVTGVQERTDLKDLFWFEMLENGFWTTRRGMFALILDTPDEELDRFVACVEEFVKKYKRFVEA